MFAVTDICYNFSLPCAKLLLFFNYLLCIRTQSMVITVTMNIFYNCFLAPLGPFLLVFLVLIDFLFYCL